MATTLAVIIDKIKGERNKDKASTQGFLYTLHRSVNGVEQRAWKKRGICKAQLRILNENIIKPENPQVYKVSILMSWHS